VGLRLVIEDVFLLNERFVKRYNLSNCWQMRPQQSRFTMRCGNHDQVENWPL